MTSLEVVIEHVPIESLRDLLLSVCKNHGQTREEVSKAILVPANDGTGLKNSAYQPCRTCGEQYHVELDKEDDCHYHPGTARLRVTYLAQSADLYNQERKRSIPSMNSGGGKENTMMSLTQRIRTTPISWRAVVGHAVRRTLRIRNRVAAQ